MHSTVQIKDHYLEPDSHILVTIQAISAQDVDVASTKARDVVVIGYANRAGRIRKAMKCSVSRA